VSDEEGGIPAARLGCDGKKILENVRALADSDALAPGRDARLYGRQDARRYAVVSVSGDISGHGAGDAVPPGVVQLRQGRGKFPGRGFDRELVAADLAD